MAVKSKIRALGALNCWKNRKLNSSAQNFTGSYRNKEKSKAIIYVRMISTGCSYLAIRTIFWQASLTVCFYFGLRVRAASGRNCGWSEIYKLPCSYYTVLLFVSSG